MTRYDIIGPYEGKWQVWGYDTYDKPVRFISEHADFTDAERAAEVATKLLTN